MRLPRQLGLALLPGMTFLLVFVWRAGENPFGPHRFTLFDDAMISMSYARTFAETGELVWFEGADRVQGFTNPLWTAYMGLIHLLGFTGSGAALIVSLTGIGLIVGSAILMFFIVSNALKGHRNAILSGSIAAGIVPFLYPLTFWTLRGMETGILALLLLVLLRELFLTWESDSTGKSFILMSVATTMGVLTRIDFAVLVAAVCLALLVVERTNISLRKVAVLATSTIVSLVVVLLFQKIYFNSWLPNTYHLKVEGVSIFERLSRGFLSSAKLITPGLLLYLIFHANKNQKSGSHVHDKLLLMTSVIAGAVAYSIWVGGDAWEYSLLINRYVSVVLPVYLTVVVIGAQSIDWARLIKQRKMISISTAVVCLSTIAGVVGVIPESSLVSANGFRQFVMVTGSIIVIVFFWSLDRQKELFSTDRFISSGVGLLSAVIVAGYPLLLWGVFGGLHVEDDQVKTEQSYALGRVTTDDAVIAVLWAGAPSYYSQRSMVDLLGKSDPVIAYSEPFAEFYPGHNKMDLGYSIGELRPEVVFEPRSADYERIASFGYVAGCLGVAGERPSFFLEGSPRIIWDRVTDCPKT